MTQPHCDSTEEPSRATSIPGTKIVIPREDLRFITARSPGPGGQNVNKVNTKVTLRFDLSATQSLTSAQEARIREKLATRITREGILHITASRHRTQAANRQATIERFAELLAEALRPEKIRRATRTPSSAKYRRREEKGRRAQTKRLRKTPRNEDP